MTHEMLTDALHRIAERAEPVDGLAQTAIRRATRRRAALVTTGAAAAVVLALLPFAVVNGTNGPARRAEPGAGAGPALPVDDAAERRITQRCMRNGPPTGSLAEPRPDLGRQEDFRLLTSLRIGQQTVAMVGSVRGFVLCVMDTGTNFQPPGFHPWPGSTGRRIPPFTGDVRIDVIASMSTTAYRGPALMDLHHVVAGRVKPGVVRVTVTWDRGRHADATVRNGFFIARTDGRMLPDRDRNGHVIAGAWHIRTERVESVIAYDTAGRVRQVWKLTGHEGQSFEWDRNCVHPVRGTVRPTLCG
ncbi:hypothetical protein ACRYCC_02925 [Actinomadura scrupuli]|uniref:hypothetical protein n=1 Tax=Actinomadura scrupuli TaxID=559629 RepID=UPI003D990B38